MKIELASGFDGVRLEMCEMESRKPAGAQRLREDASINTITSDLRIPMSDS